MIYGVKASNSAKDITDNAFALDAMAHGSPSERAFHRERVKNALHLIVITDAGKTIFAPVKWCCAESNSAAGYERNKAPTTDHFKPVAIRHGFRPLTKGHPRFDQIYAQYLAYCLMHGFAHSKTVDPRTFYVDPRDSWFAEEVRVEPSYIEGSTKKIIVNAYERDRKARDACILHHGCSCVACGFNFEKVYGKLGTGYIHVHHTVALSRIRRSYKVNPKTDLVPLCPNCHAMIHREVPELSVAELRRRLKQRVRTQT